MTRIFQAAGFAAAAVVLSATATIAAPITHSATAIESADGTAPGLFAGLFRSAAAALAGPAPETAAPTAPPSLDALVADYQAPATLDRTQDCLAEAVYFESRGEPITGQLAVAEVVLNRAASGRYPADPCAVITQRAQFSFVRRGHMPAADRESPAWRKAVAIAHIAQGRLASALPADVLWYHAAYVAPGWGRRLTRQSRIGLHIFYS